MLKSNKRLSFNGIPRVGPPVVAPQTTWWPPRQHGGPAGNMVAPQTTSRLVISCRGEANLA
eukprot:355187-Chlamydomonas_euryale.AAC.7